MTLRRHVIGLAAGAALATALPASAQDAYPARPITIVVGFAPGGITDIIARAMGQEASRVLKQSVVIENKPGAAGLIAAESVARSTPDGYTLLMTANNHTINPALRPRSKLDAAADFTPIALLAATPNMLVVPANSPHKSLAGFVVAAKAKSGAVSYGSSGIGTSPHISGEHFGSVIGTRFVHVPYKGSNQSLMAAVANEVDSTWSAAALQLLKAGKVRALGVASDKRFALAPDIPTFAEQGYKGFESEVWVGLLGPARMPQAIATKWNDILQQLLKRPDIQQMLAGQGYAPIHGVAHEAFQRRIEREVATYRRVVTEANIQAE